MLPIDWLVEKGVVDRAAVWWHLPYQPRYKRFDEGAGEDFRKIVQLREFKSKIVDLGTHRVLAPQGVHTKYLQLKVFGGEEIPLVIVPLRFRGRNLRVLVTARPFSEREAGVSAQNLLKQIRIEGGLPLKYSVIFGKWPGRVFLPHVRGIVRQVKGQNVFFHLLKYPGVGENESEFSSKREMFLDILSGASKKMGLKLWGFDSHPLQFLHDYGKDYAAKLEENKFVQKKRRFLGKEAEFVSYHEISPKQLSSAICPVDVQGITGVPVLVSGGIVKGVYSGVFHPNLLDYSAPYSEGRGLPTFCRFRDKKFASRVKIGLFKQYGVRLPVEVAAPGKPKRI